MGQPDLKYRRFFCNSKYSHYNIFPYLVFDTLPFTANGKWENNLDCSQLSLSFHRKKTVTKSVIEKAHIHFRRSSRWLQRISPRGTLWKKSSWLRLHNSRPGILRVLRSMSVMLNSFITHTTQWSTWSVDHCTGSRKKEEKYIKQLITVKGVSPCPF